MGRGRPKKVVERVSPKAFEGYLVDAPEFLMSLRGPREFGRNSIMMAETLKNLPVGKCVALPIQEFEAKFPSNKRTFKNVRHSIITYFKKAGLFKADVYLDGERVFFFRRTEV